MSKVTDAVILMAGTGSRLRESGITFPKPLVTVGGRPVISYAIDALEKIGVRNLHAVVGDNPERLLAGLKALVPASMKLQTSSNPEWYKQNGISLLAAEGKVTAPFFLLMGDHLIESAMLETLLAKADLKALNLAVDSKLKAIFDLNDAMKVQTKNGNVVAVGKDLADYDAIDTGTFLSSNEIFAYLQRAKKEGDGDCSLADGVKLMAADGKVRAIDIGEAWWQDIDTPEMLERAEEQAGRLLKSDG